MICLQCGNEQATGILCEKCGNKLDEPLLDSASTGTQETVTRKNSLKPKRKAEPSEPNIHVDKLKLKLKSYSTYFIQKLKKPALAFQQGERDLSNGLISIILFAVLYTVSLFLVIGSWSESPNFFSFFILVVLLTFVLIGIVLLSLFIINKYFGDPHSFKKILGIFSGHLSPLIISLTLSILLMIIKSYTYGNFLLVSSFVFALFILPIYLINFLATKKTGVDPLYIIMLYIVSFSILCMILVTILADSTLGRYFDSMIYLF